ncbi:hypothetical protein RSAG8_06328, partial [Rhizoctonia solani AG-8 WAC10335]
MFATFRSRPLYFINSARSCSSRRIVLYLAAHYHGERQSRRCLGSGLVTSLQSRGLAARGMNNTRK